MTFTKEEKKKVQQEQESEVNLFRDATWKQIHAKVISSCSRTDFFNVNELLTTLWVAVNIL